MSDHSNDLRITNSMQEMKLKINLHNINVKVTKWEEHMYLLWHMYGTIEAYINSVFSSQINI